MTRADGDISVVLERAAALVQAGRFKEAETAYRRVLAVRTDLPDAWYNLAVVESRLGRPEAAIAAYQMALDHGVARPEEVHLNRAVIFSERLRRDGAAEAELEAALALDPGFVPALLNLGNLEEDRGRRAEARALYERALERDPRCWLALARLVDTSARRGDPHIIGRLREALALAELGPSDRALLGFALGKALDAAGDYDAAFSAYSAANAASRADGRAAYDRGAQDAVVDALIAAFPAAPSAEVPPDAPAPVFICGMFRSGSTLAEQVLAAHPRVTAGGELGLISAIVRGPLAPFPQTLAQVPPERLEALAKRYLDAKARLFPGADVVTDKRPDNFLYIGLIKRMFPGARIVHTVRDPLDTCLSIHFTDLLGSLPYATDLEDTAHYFRAYRRLMAHWRALYGAAILDLDYDGLVRAPRPAVERLLAHCGLAWDEACLAFHEAQGSVKTASVWQVREPLYTRSSGRWRDYERHLGGLRRALEE